MIEISGLIIAYGKARALDGVSFSVQDGKVAGLVGVNGAGKTTTIKIAAGVLAPTSGTVKIDGKDTRKEKAEASRAVGWVPSRPRYRPR